MKRYITLLAINVAVFLLLQSGVIIIIFLSGLASSDAHLQGQWIVYGIFCLIHVIVFIAIPYFRRSSSGNELLIGAFIIILSWVIMGWYLN